MRFTVIPIRCYYFLLKYAESGKRFLKNHARIPIKKKKGNYQCQSAVLRLSAAIKVVAVVAKAAAGCGYLEAKIGIKFITSCCRGPITNANCGFRLTCARTLRSLADQKTLVLILC